MKISGVFQVFPVAPQSAAHLKFGRVILFSIVLAGAAALSGCASQSAPAYSWSHVASGEYLFAFDTRECGEFAGAAMAATPGAPPTGSPEFFACMRDRGYFLVDPATGRPLAAGPVEVAPGIYEPQAAR